MYSTQDKFNILAITISAKDAFWGVFSKDLELQSSDRIKLDGCISSSDYLRSLRESPALHDTYGRVVICLKSAQCLAIPKTLKLNDQQQRSYHQIIVEQPVGQTISVVTQTDIRLYHALLSLYPKAMITSLGTLLVDHVHPTAKQVAALHIDKDMIYMAVYDGQRCRILQAVEASTKEDYLYLLLHNIQIAGLDPSELILKLSGDIYQDSRLYDLIKKYIRKVELIAPERLTLRTKLPDSVKQRYFELYATAACV